MVTLAVAIGMINTWNRIAIGFRAHRRRSNNDRNFVAFARNAL